LGNVRKSLWEIFRAQERRLEKEKFSPDVRETLQSKKGFASSKRGGAGGTTSVAHSSRKNEQQLI